MFRIDKILESYAILDIPLPQMIEVYDTDGG